MKTLFIIVTAIFLVTTVLPTPLLSVPLSDMDLDWFRERPIEPEWGPDPFVPKVSISVRKGSAARPFVLTAVLRGGDEPAAVLNGSIVHAGETFQGHKVVRIKSRSIFLRGPSGTTEVPLMPLFSLEGQTP